jgi:hypothetical protein
MNFKSDIFEPDVHFTLEEANGEADGQSVLAKVRGCFFVPDGTSRNRRFYPKSLWEKALAKKEIKEKLASKRMFGTIGHDQVINDNAILEGKISHIVTNLTIDENGQGIGEALILDTPAGRGLNTLLKAGSKLFVSSRALGRFKGEKNGLPVVDETSYQLQTFDFVIDPGFLEAKPELKESLDALFDEKAITNHNDKQTGEIGMENKELAQHIIDENSKLKKDVTTAVEENDSLKNKLAVANNEIENLKEENEELTSVKEEVEAYKAFGSVEEIKEAIEAKEKAETALAEFKAIDSDVDLTAEMVIEAVDKAQGLITEYKKIGSPSQITETLEKLAEFKDAVLEYGTIEELEEIYSFASELIEKEKEAKKNEAIVALAEELGVAKSKIEKVYDKLTEEEIKEAFGGLKEEGTSKDEIKETFSTEEVDLEEGKEDETSEDEEEFDFEKSSLVESIMGKYSR